MMTRQSTHRFSTFPKRRVLKKRCINTNTIHYELELYEREPLEEFENGIDDRESYIETYHQTDFQFLVVYRMACDYC